MMLAGAFFFTLIWLRANVLIPSTATPKHTSLIWTLAVLCLVIVPLYMWQNGVEQSTEAYLAAFVEQFLEGREQSGLSMKAVDSENDPAN